ncbi:hypothetical protein [Marinobacter sp. ANT_B65]|uniref:hypothetical protein n=1 Tax=Marinobacter sp. ANT_B65 TaxID=2039467 RepID=UPI000BBE41D0|nr:hypothetical protein [Marinobacter sp. ANT_B65]PCM45808.1 hypothetical protein CPA50_07510 [Marinobacter sp. ANT_B65]
MFTWIKGGALKASPILFGTLLAACGGGGGNSSSDTNASETNVKLAPGGYATGIVYGDGSTEEAITLLSPTGKFVTVVYLDSITVGTLQFGSDGSISGSGTDVTFDSSWETINGTLTGKTLTSGTATITAGIAGVENKVTLERDHQYSDLGITMSALTGTYSMSDPEVYPTTVTVAEDGTITGSDTTGCAFNGSVSIPDTKYNVFEVSYKASNCADSLRNGQFFGLGAYDPELMELEFAGTDREVTAVFIGTK